MIKPDFLSTLLRVIITMAFTGIYSGVVGNILLQETPAQIPSQKAATIGLSEADYFVRHIPITSPVHLNPTVILC